jgi:hypothetical protein
MDKPRQPSAPATLQPNVHPLSQPTTSKRITDLIQTTLMMPIHIKTIPQSRSDIHTPMERELKLERASYPLGTRKSVHISSLHVVFTYLWIGVMIGGIGIVSLVLW